MDCRFKRNSVAFFKYYVKVLNKYGRQRFRNKYKNKKYEKKSENPEQIRIFGHNVAERVGFEPTARCRVTGFQDRLLKPLGHLSESSLCIITFLYKIAIRKYKNLKIEGCKALYRILTCFKNSKICALLFRPLEFKGEVARRAGGGLSQALLRFPFFYF